MRTLVPFAETVEIVHGNSVHPMQRGTDDAWVADRDCAEYLLRIDGKYVVCDPTNPDWTAREDGALISVNRVDEYHSTLKKTHHSLVDSGFCNGGYTPDFQPIGRADKFNSSDREIFHFMNLRPVESDLLITYFWNHRAPKRIMHVYQFVLDKNPDTKDRHIFMGIEVNQKLTGGPWSVLVFVNGYRVCENDLTYVKFVTYNSKGAFV